MKYYFLVITVLALCLGMFPLNSHAFILGCEADVSFHAVVVGKTTMKCIEPRTGTTFSSEEIEIGPGLRTAVFADNKGSAGIKGVAVICPFMRAKRLNRMKVGSSLYLAGIVADANVFVGARVGLQFGKPGVCFVVGATGFEFGAEVAFDGMMLTKH